MSEPEQGKHKEIEEFIDTMLDEDRKALIHALGDVYNELIAGNFDDAKTIAADALDIPEGQRDKFIMTFASDGLPSGACGNPHS